MRLYTVFIVGTAGSGKSHLTASFSAWLKDQGQTVSTVNLDPAAVALPYDPDVDVRESVDYERIMASRGLGPNAALIASIREVVRNLEELKEEVMNIGSDFILIDTPGQLELFAFRREGRMLANGLAPMPKAMLFLLDPIFCINPRNFASSMLLLSSTFIAFGLPLIGIVSKSDAVPKKLIKRMLRWKESDEAFYIDVERRMKGLNVHISKEVLRAVYEVTSNFPLIPVSSLKMSGFTNLHAMLTRIMSEGEMELR